MKIKPITCERLYDPLENNLSDTEWLVYDNIIGPIQENGEELLPVEFTGLSLINMIREYIEEGKI